MGNLLWSYTKKDLDDMEENIIRLEKENKLNREYRNELAVGAMLGAFITVLGLVFYYCLHSGITMGLATGLQLVTTIMVVLAVIIIVIGLYIVTASSMEYKDVTEEMETNQNLINVFTEILERERPSR